MKLPLLLTLSACLLTAPAAKAGTLLTLSDSAGAPDSVTINPGDSFEFTLTFESTAELSSAISYYLEADGAGSGAFTITGRDITNSAFPDLVTDNSIALSPANAGLSAINGNDLGGLTASGTNGIGSFLVARFTLLSQPGIAPGTYTIGTNAAFALDENFEELPLNRPTYSITVVPEPGSTLLLALSAATALTARRRRK